MPIAAVFRMAGRQIRPQLLAGALVAATGEFRRIAHIPTLWLYAENDRYFPPRG